MDATTVTWGEFLDNIATFPRDIAIQELNRRAALGMIQATKEYEARIYFPTTQRIARQRAALLGIDFDNQEYLYTRDEYVRSHYLGESCYRRYWMREDGLVRAHLFAVECAIEQGDSIPSEVLADYPQFSISAN